MEERLLTLPQTYAPVIRPLSPQFSHFLHKIPSRHPSMWSLTLPPADVVPPRIPRNSASMSSLAMSRTSSEVDVQRGGTTDDSLATLTHVANRIAGGDAGGGIGDRKGKGKWRGGGRGLGTATVVTAVAAAVVMAVFVFRRRRG